MIKDIDNRDQFDIFLKKIDNYLCYTDGLRIFQKACEYNDNKIFNHLFEKKILDIDRYVQECCRDGYLEICKYLFEIYETKHKKIDYNRLFVSTCLSNKIENIKYVLEKNKFFNKHIFYGKYFKKICKSRNSEIISFVLDNVPYKCCHKIFDILCAHGCIDNAICIYNENNLHNYPMLSTIFEKMCKNNQLQTIKFVLENIKHINYGNAFDIACREINIELIELLLENSLPIDRETIDKEFVYACKNNKFDIVKILLENFSGINVHVNDEYIFKKCCREGNLEMAMMLKKYNPNINHHIDRDYCYGVAKSREMLDWLESDCPITISNTKSARKMKF